MKAVKYILLGLAPLVLIVGLVFYMSGSGDGKARISSTVTLCDVATGELVTLDRKDVIVIPTANKRDGKRTLFPISENDDGTMVIDGRFHDMLRELAKSEKLAVDTKTFAVPSPK